MERIHALHAAFVVSLLSIVGTVHAALPASTQTAFTDLETDFETIFGYGYAVLLVVVVSMLAWRYTRKFGSKV